MKEKIKCKHCKLLIDEDSRICPYCGSDQLEKEQEIKEEKTKKTKFKLDDVKLEFANRSKGLQLDKIKQLILFLTGLVGLLIISLIVSLFISIVGEEFVSTPLAQGLSNHISYFILFIILLGILNKDLLKIFKDFKLAKLNYLYGFLMGLGLIAINMLCSFLIGLGNFESNDNQVSIIEITNILPISSFLIFGILGPICEEITYRLGFFAFIKRYNTYLAYIINIILFSLIHFNVASENIVQELANLPVYMISAFLLSLSYDKFGFVGSLIPHIMNNSFSLILIYAGV